MGEHQVLSTISWALVLGIILVQVAHKIRISAIVVLLIGGVFVGPHCIGLVHPEELSTETLKTIVALAVALILFEGGLTLNIRDYRKVSTEIRGLLVKGVFVTWFGVSACIYLFFPHFSLEFILLASSLVIVTGPTVIGPLLKKIHAQKNISSILHWEGILIDPIGVFIALLCYEWIISGKEQAVALLTYRIFLGVLIGSISGFLITFVVKKSWILNENLNPFVLAAAIATFSFSEHFAHESGLLSVTIAGFLIGYLDRGEFEQVKAYKAQLVEMLIGLLFILLAANLDVYSFANYSWPLVGVVLLVMFLVRPLNVFISTYKSSLNLKEKLFLSWIAPRGIVAASMASLFTLSLQNGVYEKQQAQFLEVLTYSIIIGTVLFQGLTAKFVGKSLGVLIPKPSDWLIIGSHKLGRSVASFIQEEGQTVALMDSNPRAIRLAQEKKLIAICKSALVANPEEHPELYDVGHILIMTPNESLNALICQHWKKEIPAAQIYHCNESKNESPKKKKVGTQIWQDLPFLRLLSLADEENLEVGVKKVPLAEIKNPEHVLLFRQGEDIFPFFPQETEGEGTALVYYEKSIE